MSKRRQRQEIRTTPMPAEDSDALYGKEIEDAKDHLAENHASPVEPALPARDEPKERTK